MSLAYTFWHQPRPGVDVDTYELDLGAFHRRLAGVPIPGFLGSWTVRVPELPWLAGGGYEDWYLVGNFAGLGVLNRAAVDQARSSHDALARAVRDGAGGVYAQLHGRLDPPAVPGWVGWFRKRDGVGFPQLLAELDARVKDGAVRAVWQRQMVLGPAPEFRVEAGDPLELAGADLALAVPVAAPVLMSG